MAELELVGHTLIANSSNKNRNIENVLAKCGRMKVALDVNARKANRATAFDRMDAEPERPDQLVLGRFHVVEERGKVHDACHVGVVEFDQTRRTKRLRHQ